uniref:peptidase dimerization domain-containing protein n=1 Tax=Sinorhizobium chiapasense TaxID=501572 RepID=UPI002FE4091C
MVAQLQTVVSRQVDPANSAVLTVGSIHGGRTQNIIPDACIFEGTVRCRSPEARDIVEDAFRTICNGAGQTLNVAVDIDYVRGVPSVMDDEGLVTRATEAFTQHFGEAPLIFGRGLYREERGGHH